MVEVGLKRNQSCSQFGFQGNELKALFFMVMEGGEFKGSFEEFSGLFFFLLLCFLASLQF
jgi:hypothetical protein